MANPRSKRSAASWLRDLRRWLAKHDYDQPPSGSGWRSPPHWKTSRTGKAGLHAVGAGIAAEQTIMIGYVLPPELKRADAEEVRMVGKFAQERTGDDRHVPG